MTVPLIMTQTDREALEALGEALHGLSAMLLSTGALEDDKTHAAYEKVVARFQLLAGSSPEETDDGPCTDCDDTGWMFQTERYCTCEEGIKCRSMKVAVTQEDKDASAELAVAMGMSAETFTSGAADVIVQAFARHRQQAEATGKAEIEGLRAYIVECDASALEERNALRGALAAIVADPDCCVASKATARAGLGFRT